MLWIFFADVKINAPTSDETATVSIVAQRSIARQLHPQPNYLNLSYYPNISRADSPSRQSTNRQWKRLASVVYSALHRNYWFADQISSQVTSALDRPALHSFPKYLKLICVYRRLNRPDICGFCINKWFRRFKSDERSSQFHLARVFVRVSLDCRIVLQQNLIFAQILFIQIQSKLSLLEKNMMSFGASMPFGNLVFFQWFCLI